MLQSSVQSDLQRESARCMIVTDHYLPLKLPGLEAVGHASEAVLPLALSDPAALQRSGDALLAACADGTAKVRAG